MSQYGELVEMIQQGKLVETQNLVKALLDEDKSPDDIIQKGIAKALDIVGNVEASGVILGSTGMGSNPVYTFSGNTGIGIAPLTGTSRNEG